MSQGTVFDGEIAAIRTALSQLQCHLEKFTRAAVSDNNPITQDVLDCRHDLKNLSSLGKTIVLQWVPTHCGIPGNEKADFLTKKGVLVMQKVSRPLSFHSIKNLIKRSIKAHAQEDFYYRVSHKSW
ncbi:RNase H domain-containing protein [Trichonephila clavipes]|nr:RNase H domain-containing protein [Trichonephila clavipes]